MSIGSEKLVMRDISQKSNIPITVTRTNDDMPFKILNCSYYLMLKRKIASYFMCSMVISTTFCRPFVAGVVLKNKDKYCKKKESYLI